MSQEAWHLLGLLLATGWAGASRSCLPPSSELAWPPQSRRWHCPRWHSFWKMILRDFTCKSNILLLSSVIAPFGHKVLLVSQAGLELEALSSFSRVARVTDLPCFNWLLWHPLPSQQHSGTPCDGGDGLALQSYCKHESPFYPQPSLSAIIEMNVSMAILTSGVRNYEEAVLAGTWDQLSGLLAYGT